MTSEFYSNKIIPFPPWQQVRGGDFRPPSRGGRQGGFPTNKEDMRLCENPGNDHISILKVCNVGPLRFVVNGVIFFPPLNGRRSMGFTGVISPRNKWSCNFSPTYNWCLGPPCRWEDDFPFPKVGYVIVPSMVPQRANG